MTPTEFKEIREGLGMSQAAIAEELMCHVRTVQKYEGGERGVPALAAKELRRLRDE